MEAVLRMNMADAKMGRDLEDLADFLGRMQPQYAAVVASPILERLVVYLDRVLRIQQDCASVTYRSTQTQQAAATSKGSFRREVASLLSAGPGSTVGNFSSVGQKHTPYAKGALSEIRATERPATGFSQSLGLVNGGGGAGQKKRMADLTLAPRNIGPVAVTPASRALRRWRRRRPPGQAAPLHPQGC
jgi:hypothetical protein